MEIPMEVKRVDVGADLPHEAFLRAWDACPEVAESLPRTSIVLNFDSAS